MNDLASAQRVTLAATEAEWLGLYRAKDFRITDGTCGDCATIPSARWYFERETIAVPEPGLPIAGYSRGVETFDDVRAWRKTRAADAPIEYPPLIWIGAPALVRHARISADGESLDAAGLTLPIERVAKIPLNRSYYDESTTRFFASRSVTARGFVDGDGRFIVRTMWPEDFRLRNAPPSRCGNWCARSRTAARGVRLRPSRYGRKHRRPPIGAAPRCWRSS